MGSPLYAKERFNKDIFESLESRIQDVIRAQTESRKLFPVDTMEMNLDTVSKFWDKMSESIGVGYNYQIVDVPEADFETERNRDDIPAIVAAMAFPFDEWRHLSKANLSLNDRVTAFSKGWAINEDIKAIIGDANTGVASAASSMTDISGSITADVTTLAKIHTTVSSLFNEWDDAAEFNSSEANMKCVVTRDVRKKMRTVIDATGDGVTNGWKYAQELVKDWGGPGSELITSKYLSGSSTFAAGRKNPTVTAGAQTIALYPFDPEVSKIIATNQVRNEDPLTVRNGKYIRFAERWRWVTRRSELMLIDAGVVIS